MMIERMILVLLINSKRISSIAGRSVTGQSYQRETMSPFSVKTNGVFNHMSVYNARTIRSYGAVGHEKELTGIIDLRK